MQPRKRCTATLLCSRGSPRKRVRAPIPMPMATASTSAPECRPLIELEELTRCQKILSKSEWQRILIIHNPPSRRWMKMLATMPRNNKNRVRQYPSRRRGLTRITGSKAKCTCKRSCTRPASKKAKCKTICAGLKTSTRPKRPRSSKKALPSSS